LKGARTEHLAVSTRDLERLRDFYARFLPVLDGLTPVQAGTKVRPPSQRSSLTAMP